MKFNDTPSPIEKLKNRVDLKGKTRKVFADMGWRVANTEHMNPHSGKLRDLFGFGDLFMFYPDGNAHVILQVTDAKNGPARKRKILENPIAKEWVQNTSTRNLWLVMWKKRGNKWEMKIEIITEQDFICRGSYDQDAGSEGAELEHELEEFIAKNIGEPSNVIDIGKRTREE